MATAVRAAVAGKIATKLASHGVLEIPASIREANLSRLVTICSQKRVDEECSSRSGTGAATPPPSFAATFDNTAHLMLFFLDNGMPRHSISRTFRSIPALSRIPYDRERFLRILWLLRSIGDDQTVQKFVRRVPDIFARDPEELQITINALRGLKLEKSFLAKRPCFLYLENLPEMTSFLRQHGVSRAGFGKILKRWRGAVDISLERFKDKIGELTQCGVRGKNLERFITKYPWFLKSDNVSVEECYPLLKSHGIEGARFAQMVAFHPGTLRVSAEGLRVAEQVLVSAGIEQDMDIFKSALSVAALTNPKVLESRISRYVNYGFTSDESREMVRKQPRLLRVSDRFLQLKMRFLLHCVKLSREMIIKSPNYLLYSLEERLKPRFHFAGLALLDGGFRVEFKWKGIFYSSESMFQEMFKRVSPEAFELYKRRVNEKKKKKKKKKKIITTRKMVKPASE